MLTCRECDLAKGRTRVVPGEGPDDATVMFIGEAPGQNEDRLGRPFVGAAGQFLDELLGLAGLKRSEVYICNVIKCRPPGNRDPLPAEIMSCKPWLEQQIALKQPKVIVTLGRYSMARWFPGQSISRIHGQPAEKDGVLVYPMYHPAAALHQAALKETIQNDMRQLGRLLQTLDGRAPAEGTPVTPIPPPAAPAPPLELRSQPTQTSLAAALPAAAAAAQPPTPKPDESQQLSMF